MSIICISGRPGGGKSYYMTLEIIRAIKEQRPVFSNFPLIYKGVSSYKLRYEDLLECSFPEGSLLCIDEANAWFRNRDWAKFPKDAFLFFMHHRHFKVDMILCAQSPMTLDTNIRDIISNYVWASVMCIGRRALWFKYMFYSTIEDCIADKNRIASRRKFARQSVFKNFDSYYKFVELQRKPHNLERWEEEFLPEEFPATAGTEEEGIPGI